MDIISKDNNHTGFETIYLMRFIVVILAFTTIMLVIQAVLPVQSMRRMIYQYKYESILNKAEIISSSLNTSTTITSEWAEEVMSAIGAADVSQVLITDENGSVLYSSNTETTPVGPIALYPEIVAALKGNDAFQCRMNGDEIDSYGAIPVISSGVVIGSVYVAEIDPTQAALISSAMDSAVHLALIAVLVCLMLYIFSHVMVSRKIESMLASIRTIRSGDYSYRLPETGNNEYARLGTEINSLAHQLQQNKEEQRRFVSDASHELRTPLAAIRLLADTIVDNEMDTDTMREFIRDISDEAERLTRMTRKLTALSAFDARSDESEELQVVNLGECCQKAVRLLGPLGEEHGLQMEQNSEEHCCILANSDDIFEIVLNLAENAVKYTPPGGIVRLVAFARGEQAVMIVEDSGIGIPEDALEQIFERFYRVDKARSREAGGSGLGLSIVKETAERYGGTVTAENRVQGGSRFTLVFPLVKWEGEP